jgi:hypothetical protein
MNCLSLSVIRQAPHMIEFDGTIEAGRDQVCGQRLTIAQAWELLLRIDCP